MKGQIRNIYPGGNTPYGFYSYYNHILPQRKAKKIFCIKGGPGVGKSTLMRKIGTHFVQKGEDVDLLWCSSDPDSLDGVVLRERGVALVDGTSPHIVDPKNPGAVDEILDLSRFWDGEKIRGNRGEIIRCNERIGECFAVTYGYLGCAGEQYRFLAELLDRIISPEKLLELRAQIDMKLNGFTDLRRAENRMKREQALGTSPLPGNRKKAFAGAITPGGIKSGLDSLIGRTERILYIRVPVGFRTEKLLRPVADRLTAAGWDIEEYYCPMEPETRLEHILSADGKLAVFCCNQYHDLSQEALTGRKVNSLQLSLEEEETPLEEDESRKELMQALAQIQEDSEVNLSRALTCLKRAKAWHDTLESFYIPHMDFAALDRLEHEIVGKIEEDRL